MSLLAEAFNPRPRAASGGPGPLDDFWYTRDVSGYVAGASGGAIGLSAESIMRCGTVLAAVRFRGDSWAMCPPSTYRRLPGGGREDDPLHPSQLVLRNPNRWQTGNRWRHLMGVWLATWGNAYSRIVPGPRYAVGELWPIHPSTIRVKDQRSDGSLLYEITRRAGGPEIVGSEEILHFRDIGTDGFGGLAMYQLVRNVVGIALLAEQHASVFLRKGTRVAGLIMPSAPLNEEQRQVLRESANAELGGASATGTLGLLPWGVTVQPLGISNRDAQFLEMGDQVVGSILRALGVPGVVVGWQGDKASTYASAKEFFESGGIKHCVLPILTNVEAEEEKSLLVAGDGRFIRHNLDVLLRANLKDRYEAFSKALGGAPFLSVNDVRAQDDWNPDPDPRHDEIRIPANLTPLAAPVVEPEPAPRPARDPEPEPEPEPPHDDGGQSDDAARQLPATRVSGPSGIVDLPDPDAGAAVQRAQQFEAVARQYAQFAAVARQYALDNAGRVIRRERESIVAKAPKYARARDGWRAYVLEAYGKHAAYVSEVMRIEPAQAAAYCEAQAAALLAHGAGVAETWESAVSEKLVALALQEA